MRKHPFFTVLLFAVLGASCAVLRYLHSNYYYDQSGLPIYGTVSAALTAVSAAAAVLALILAVVISAKYKPSDMFAGTFQAKKGGASLAVQIVAAVFIGVSAVLRYLSNTEVKRTVAAAGCVLGIIAAIALIYLALRIYKGEEKSYLGYVFLIPAFYFCMLLIMIFSANAKNPLMITFSFQCAAVGAAALYLCAVGGYALKKPQPFTVSFTGFVCITFSIISITGRTVTLADILTYLGMIGFVAPLQTAFLRNLTPKTE